MKKIWTIFLAAFILTLITGCAGRKEAEREIYAMDTYMSVRAYGDESGEAVDEAIEEIRKLDRMLSAVSKNSVIYEINEKGQGRLQEEAAELFDRSLEISEMTGGSFDITIYPLVRLWGFSDGNFCVPDSGRLSEELSKVGYGKIEWDKKSGRLKLSQGQMLDMGAIAKGYAGDRVREIFQRHGIESGLIYLGGNVLCYGQKPEGGKWRCGIKDPLHPEDNSRYLGCLYAQDLAIVTSGAYERYFTDPDTGNIYHHILDPATGYPARSGIISSTIIAKDAALADALSTAAYVSGRKKAELLWRQHREEFDMILMTEDGKLYITPGIAGDFEASYPCEIIEK